MKHFKLTGSRVLKTGVAIFITAWICVLLDWPPVFAVITAIVTIEPTVSDSIKKGFIRFPASAIGSGYAVLFITLFGDSPITYTLAAMFTIATCYRLNLHAGLLVATLTSVAMVDVIHTNVLISFFIRLGTTTIGLLVSTAVNMFVLPPDYTKQIAQNIEYIAGKTSVAIENVFQDILMDNNTNQFDKRLVDQLNQIIQKTERLIQFQTKENKYHPLAVSERAKFEHAQKQLTRLELMHYHLYNLINIPLEHVTWSQEKRSDIMHAVEELTQSLRSESLYNEARHREQEKQLTQIFWEKDDKVSKKDKQNSTDFPPDLIFLYELVSIYNLVERFYKKPQ